MGEFHNIVPIALRSSGWGAAALGVMAASVSVVSASLITPDSSNRVKLRSIHPEFVKRQNALPLNSTLAPALPKLTATNDVAKPNLAVAGPRIIRDALIVPVGPVSERIPAHPLPAEPSFPKAALAAPSSGNPIATISATTALSPLAAIAEVPAALASPPLTVMASGLSDKVHIEQITVEVAPTVPISSENRASLTAMPYGQSAASQIDQISARAPGLLASRTTSTAVDTLPKAGRADPELTSPSAYPHPIGAVGSVTPKPPEGPPTPKLATTSSLSVGSSGSDSRYKVTPQGLALNIAVMVNGTASGRVALLVDKANSISIRLADVLAAVRPLMDDPTFARLSAAGAAQDYISFAALRQAGINLRYDADGDRLMLTADAHS